MSGLELRYNMVWNRLIVRWDVWEPAGANTIGFDLLFEVVLPCSVWYRAHKTLGIDCIYCTGGMCCGSAIELSGLNLGSGGVGRFPRYLDRSL